MNDEYLNQARKKVTDVRLLINGASKRAAELARGARPLVPMLPQDERSHLDIALLEIAEGKIVIQEPG
ncbi:MAG: DNA-directed RNA polymerase subunit omega [Lentisphaerae bacterium]|nr:DNA-directed RNA polymerase subunit omega [Lentisphaerota bacterium]